MTLVSEIIAAIEQVAPLSIQEEWDNSGLQVGPVDCPCTGAMVCVDITPAVIDAAVASGCNLLVSHHPLIFKPLKSVGADSLVYRAIRGGLTVYSAHTSLDNSPRGISHALARAVGLADVEVLAPMAACAECGTGIVGTLPAPLGAEEFADLLKQTFGLSALRCSDPAGRTIRRVAMVGGSGGSFIADAVAAGADALVTGDIRHHDFVDHGAEIFLADITHFDSEKCAKEILMRVISEKIANFAALKPGPDCNPINYL